MFLTAPVAHVDEAQPTTQGARCGDGGKHYQKEDVLDPGEKNFNQFSIPENARIEYFACFGGYGSVQWDKDDVARRDPGCK